MLGSDAVDQPDALAGERDQDPAAVVGVGQPLTSPPRSSAASRWVIAPELRISDMYSCVGDSR